MLAFIKISSINIELYWWFIMRGHLQPHILLFRVHYFEANNQDIAFEVAF